MRVWRAIGGEAIKALAVLALVFLSFAHSPIDAADGGYGAGHLSASITWCGAPPEGSGEDEGHAPCHACRASVAGVPQPPCLASPAFAALAGDGFSVFDAVAVDDDVFAPGHPRAPPAPV